MKYYTNNVYVAQNHVYHCNQSLSHHFFGMTKRLLTRSPSLISIAPH